MLPSSMASSAPGSPIIDATPLNTALPMGGAASAAAAAGSVPSAAATASPSSTPVESSGHHDEIALAQVAAEAAATVASASAAAADVAEEDRATEEEEEEEAIKNEGAASNPTHNWACSGVDDGELMGMAADGAIPPSSESVPSWRYAFGDLAPTPIKDERVLLSSHIA